MQAEAANATSDKAAIIGALQRAAQATGADFNYMLDIATRESGLKPSAKAGTSSASGLFQFIDQSWLAVVKQFGAKHGLGSLANAITRSSDGRYHTANSADRSAILALRNDPTVAAMMEGEYVQYSRATLQNSLGRDVCGGELYMAHFLGENEACRMIRMAETQPTANAAVAFPAAASANRPVFYHSDGTAKTVKEVYDWALRAPNASAVLPGAAPAKPAADPTPPRFVEQVDNGAATNTDALLMSIASWRPTHGFFSNDTSDGNTSAPSSGMLSSSIMDVLQSTQAVPDTGDKS
ncbi:MAG: lytic transglycosylase domain-containing protein [Alphaproteobacteria bacterium]|nr:lytic transglycosylase domain-containing protein [Alphaproteobacteria bacterium]MBL7096626.1 lytic transglycosylase domain-containing protein [Alphaproteobacteria bacterium]